MDRILKGTNTLSALFLLMLALTISLNGNAQKFSFVTKGINRVQLGETYRYSFLAVDSSVKKITYSCNKLPDWITFDKETRTILGIPKKPGQYAVHIDAANSDTAIKQNFMLTVFNSETTNILPLGNSITNGTDQYNSYRRYLWQMLNKANYNFDFIGSWDKQHMGASFPNPDFDLDHDGHSGWTAYHILEPPEWDSVRGNLNEWLEEYKPDIVLMELGTNEVFQCVNPSKAIEDFSVIVDKLRTKNSSVKILIALIPPLGRRWSDKKLCGTETNYGQSVLLFNKAIQEFAKNKATVLSPIIVVDQFSGINPDLLMYDDIHPNAEGEKIMARRWFEALKPFLKKLN
jgi:hypothetical protein